MLFGDAVADHHDAVAVLEEELLGLSRGRTAADVNTKINSEPTVDNRFLCMTCLASRI